jgi:hypothetical protein
MPVGNKWYWMGGHLRCQIHHNLKRVTNKYILVNIHLALVYNAALVRYAIRKELPGLLILLVARFRSDQNIALLL